jgi:hypothetical protein
MFSECKLSHWNPAELVLNSLSRSLSDHTFCSPCDDNDATAAPIGDWNFDAWSGSLSFVDYGSWLGRRTENWRRKSKCMPCEVPQVAVLRTATVARSPWNGQHQEMVKPACLLVTLESNMLNKAKAVQFDPALEPSQAHRISSIWTAKCLRPRSKAKP